MSAATLPLGAAAHAIYLAALDEKLPLAAIAECSGHPHHWFAANMLQIIEVVGERLETGASEVVCRIVAARLQLDAEIKSLKAMAAAQPSYANLSVASAQLQKYLDWARTVC
ncbi:MAG: hypothetical protein WCD42_02085 [Rhizomicrobium sp.]